MYIFDVDGTILNTSESIMYHGNKTFKKYGLGILKKDDFENFLGNGAKYLIDSCLDKLDFPKDEILREKILNDYNKSYDDNPYFLTKPYEGITKALKEIKKYDKIVAFSNKPDSTLQKVIGRNFGKGFFDFVLGQCNNYKRKPDPEGIYIIKERFNESLTNILYFGDTEVDFKCAKSANVNFVACSWGFREKSFLESLKPDFLIDDPKEITKIRRI
ncbi:MAG: HAD family hydrolase [Peptoniphilaceae bacterium]|nr:HAD family hydrolase [Peptoniphilaceae bacterium]MDD7383259.1 HAD family hydrolase [Peptoniphilaceae bacterium]MDY3737984.1 HAD family hydrolase [Peptoniphilaceae bacterium]